MQIDKKTEFEGAALPTKPSVETLIRTRHAYWMQLQAEFDRQWNANPYGEAHPEVREAKMLDLAGRLDGAAAVIIELQYLAGALGIELDEYL